MKKQSITIAIILALVSSFSNARSFDEIKQSGVLKVGAPADYAPLAYYDDNKKLTGFDVEMAKNLADTLEVKIEFIQTSWPTLSEDLKADKFDIAVGGITQTEKRAEEFLLSEPVVKNGKIAITNCENQLALDTLDKIDQEGVKVIVNPGGTNQIFVNDNIQNAEIILTENNFDNLDGIRQNTADIMFTDLIEADYYKTKEKGVFCLATPKIFESTKSYKVYMMNKDNTALLEQVNLWLEKPIKQELSEKWNISE